MIKILIVDDESGIRSLLSEILSEEGFLVYEAPDAAHARQMLAKETFNLILLDIWMPDTDILARVSEHGFVLLKLSANMSAEDTWRGSPPDSPINGWSKVSTTNPRRASSPAYTQGPCSLTPP